MNKKQMLRRIDGDTFLGSQPWAPTICSILREILFRLPDEEVDQPAIKPCHEGHEAKVTVGSITFFVCCEESSRCWTGPVRDTKKQAIEVWNRRMG